MCYSSDLRAKILKVTVIKGREGGATLYAHPITNFGVGGTGRAPTALPMYA